MKSFGTIYYAPQKEAGLAVHTVQMFMNTCAPVQGTVHSGTSVQPRVVNGEHAFMNI